MIVIKTPQPDIEERLVVVPVRRIVPESRDATPDDLGRGGYAPLAAFVGPLDLLTPPTLAGALQAIESIQNDADAAQDRAEKAERELAEVREAAFDADSGPGEAPTAFEAVTGLRLRVERAERERNDVLRDPCARGRSWEAMRSDRDRLLTVALDAERELVEARAELARLTAVGEVEPTDEALGCIAREVGPYRDLLGAASYRALYRLGVAHERARQQPATEVSRG